MKSQPKILIVDDSEINRSILADMLQDKYEILEAEDGEEGIRVLEKYRDEIALILLDIVMPKMDGLEMLHIMNRKGWIKEVPVIMISAENGSHQVDRAFNLGVTDFINRPFDVRIVRRRVINTVLLYSKQKRLISLALQQIDEKERQSNLMIHILSHILEYHNGESGMHMRHLPIITEILLNTLAQKNNQYHLTAQSISLISMASALHDIGKIGIPEAIINKPGRFIPEEFEIMKTHSMIGANILQSLPFYQEEPLTKVAYEICRWHHERWDGKGYPDGLKKDEIPISAQITALADVYDTLTSQRVYKPAFSHEQALQMIFNGECGSFNPLLLDCLKESADLILEALKESNVLDSIQKEKPSILQDDNYEESIASERTLELLEHERMKYNFFAAMTEEIQFEYRLYPSMITLNAWGAQKLGLKEIIMNPKQDGAIMDLLGQKNWSEISTAILNTNPSHPVITYDCRLDLGGELRWVQFIVRATWSSDESPRCLGAIGKIIDIHDSKMKLNDLEMMATHDSMTSLLNHNAAKKKIKRIINKKTNSHFALVILDLDFFKMANDTYGHLFGDEVLIYLAQKLKHITRQSDIVARIGGDEFLIFMEYTSDLHIPIERIFGALKGEYKQFPISISMGVADTDKAEKNYKALFQAADQALYAAKRLGRGQYCFYDKDMNETLSPISPIENEE